MTNYNNLFLQLRSGRSIDKKEYNYKKNIQIFYKNLYHRLKELGYNNNYRIAIIDNKYKSSYIPEHKFIIPYNRKQFDKYSNAKFPHQHLDNFEFGDKPEGAVWFSHMIKRRNNITRVDWCTEERYEMIDPNNCTYIYLVKPNFDKVLKLGKEDDIEKFTKKYSLYSTRQEFPALNDTRLKLWHSTINWRKVKKDYSGLEIYPYVGWQPTVRPLGNLRRKYSWYYTMDVSTFVAWDYDAFKDNTFKYFKFSKFNDLIKEFNKNIEEIFI